MILYLVFGSLNVEYSKIVASEATRTGRLEAMKTDISLDPENQFNCLERLTGHLIAIVVIRG